MLCALTVRKLKPGSFEQFAETFRPPDGEAPPDGWVRFEMLRDRNDPDRIVTFGFFEGSFDELESNQDREGYEDRKRRASQYVEAVEVNGVFDIVHEMVA